MKLFYQRLKNFYQSLPRSAQWFLLLLAAAVLFSSGTTIGSSLGKAVYRLVH